jgi:hypothetical protein
MSKSQAKGSEKKVDNTLANIASHLSKYNSLHDVVDDKIMFNWTDIFDSAMPYLAKEDAIEQIKDELDAGVKSVSQMLLAVARKAGSLTEFNIDVNYMRQVYKSSHKDATRLPKVLSDALGVIRAGWKLNIDNPKENALCNPLKATSVETLRKTNKAAKDAQALKKESHPIQEILGSIANIYKVFERKGMKQELERLREALDTIEHDYHAILDEVVGKDKPEPPEAGVHNIKMDAGKA